MESRKKTVVQSEEIHRTKNDIRPAEDIVQYLNSFKQVRSSSNRFSPQKFRAKQKIIRQNNSLVANHNEIMNTIDILPALEVKKKNLSKVKGHHDMENSIHNSH